MEERKVLCEYKFNNAIDFLRAGSRALAAHHFEGRNSTSVDAVAATPPSPAPSHSIWMYSYLL